MDPEFLDDAKLLAITVLFLIGVVQLGRWSWCAVRYFRDGPVLDTAYMTEVLIAGEYQMRLRQVRSRHKLQPTVLMS